MLVKLQERIIMKKGIEDINNLFNDDDDVEEETVEDVEDDMDDEEEEVPVVVKKKKAKAKVVVEEPEDDDEEDEVPVVKTKGKKVKSFFDNVVLPSGMKAAKSGVVDSRYPISKYKATKGIKDRLGFISADMLISRIHYLEGFGYFHCWGKECCEGEGLPSLYYVYLVIKYDTTSKGKMASFDDYELMFIALPETKYKENILPLTEEGIDISEVDFAITCSDTAHQKFGMTHLPTSVWRTKLDAKKIEKEALALARHIPSCMARTITIEEYNKIASTTIEDDDEEDLDSLLD